MKEKESDIQRTILDGLAAMHIWAIRMNSGAMYGSHKGKRWAVRFGRKGMADILASVERRYSSYPEFVWIEVKRPGEKQTAEQQAFEDEVKAIGHTYILATCWEIVRETINVRNQF